MSYCSTNRPHAFIHLMSITRGTLFHILIGQNAIGTKVNVRLLRPVWQTKSSGLAAALAVTKFTTVRDLILVTLNRPTYV
jgi:hypothetical protein